jgi:hypothetical protein
MIHLGRRSAGIQKRGQQEDKERGERKGMLESMTMTIQHQRIKEAFPSFLHSFILSFLHTAHFSFPFTPHPPTHTYT